mmetsp:Transcript_91512/g.296042  ORF Transcript_91512/g.296042 Transcript_91512/m.296042 type:complete len:234 (+) Transcript_91512:611-1312(+)
MARPAPARHSSHGASRRNCGAQLSFSRRRTLLAPAPVSRRSASGRPLSVAEGWQRVGAPGHCSSSTRSTQSAPRGTTPLRPSAAWSPPFSLRWTARRAAMASSCLARRTARMQSTRPCAGQGAWSGRSRSVSPTPKSGSRSSRCTWPASGTCFPLLTAGSWPAAATATSAPTCGASARPLHVQLSALVAMPSIWTAALMRCPWCRPRRSRSCWSRCPRSTGPTLVVMKARRRL